MVPNVYQLDLGLEGCGVLLQTTHRHRSGEGVGRGRSIPTSLFFFQQPPVCAEKVMLKVVGPAVAKVT